MARPTVILEWSPGTAPGIAASSWTDITAYLQAFEIQTGRPYELDRFSAGTATFTLKDTTRRFDPEYTSGAWYGQLTPGKQIRLRATYNAVTYPLFYGYVHDWGAADIPDRDNLYRTVVTAHDALTQFEFMGLPASWLELAIAYDSPLHWWRLDETTGTVAKDSGTAATLYDGTYSNPLLADSVVVPFDGGRKGVGFDTTNRGMTATWDSISDPWTVEVWFTTPNVAAFDPTFGGEPLIALGNDYANAFGSNVAADSCLVLVGIYNVTGHAGLISINAFGTDWGTHRVDDGEPHQLVIVNNGATRDWYVDGVFDGTIVGATAITRPEIHVGFNWFSAGTGGLSSPTYWTGGVANIAFWGSALNSTQILAHYNAGKLAYAGSDTGAVLGTLLDLKGWPSSLRNLGTGASVVGGYDLPATVSEFIGRMADTEAGQTYVSGDGKLTHRNRHLWLDTRSKTSQATFGDRHGAATLNYLADGFAMPLDEQQIRNPVYAERSGGVTASAQDSTLISSTYGERGYRAPAAYDQDDNVMADRARYYLSRFKSGKTRLEAMTLTPERSPTLLYPQALGRVIGDRITVKRKPLNAGNETSLDFIIEGIHHESTPGSWKTTFTGSQADTTIGWILDDATYSVLDTTTILNY